MPDDGSFPSLSGQTATVRVRTATAEDLDPLERIEKAAFATDRISRRQLQAHIGSRSALVVVAEAEGAIAGYCLVLRRRGSRIARLYSLAVHPDFAGRGVGQQLLCEAEDRARRTGAGALRLEVRADNLAGIRLYETRGYRRIGRREDYYQDGAAAIRFQRDISHAPDTLASAKHVRSAAVPA